MADDTNTAEREAYIAWMLTYPNTFTQSDAEHNWRHGHVSALAWQARASLAASAGSTEINGQLYTALNNLFTHLGMEGCITADHAFVWDAMTALKRIDGGVHLDNLAVPVDPDAHRDDILAAVQLLEDGEWAEHFAKTPIGMRLEDQITKLHSEVAASAGSEPVKRVFLVHTGEEHEGEATYTRYDDAPPPLCDSECLYTHPSPPEGMAGWTKASEQLPPCRDNQLYIGVNSAGFAGVFNAVTSIAGNVYCHYETAEESIDVLGDLAIWKQFNPPIPASEAKEL
jgi:hypothetical protein